MPDDTEGIDISAHKFLWKQKPAAPRYSLQIGLRNLCFVIDERDGSTIATCASNADAMRITFLLNCDDARVRRVVEEITRPDPTE